MLKHVESSNIWEHPVRKFEAKLLVVKFFQHFRKELARIDLLRVDMGLKIANTWEQPALTCFKWSWRTLRLSLQKINRSWNHHLVLSCHRWCKMTDFRNQPAVSRYLITIYQTTSINCCISWPFLDFLCVLGLWNDASGCLGTAWLGGFKTSHFMIVIRHT